MAKLFFVLALLFACGLFVYKLSGQMDHVASSYDTDNVMKIIENMEAPAAGGKE